MPADPRDMSFRTGSMAGRMVETRYGEVASYGIRRVEFDHYLLDRSGAKQLTGHSVKRIERADGLWRIDDVAQAPVVVGAGGHFCPVARRLGAKVGSTEDIVAAHEVEFVMTDAQRADCAVAEETPEIFFCEDLKGYGWVFRKEDVLNVGLGREDNRNIADHVKAFCEWLAARGRMEPALPATCPRSSRGMPTSCTDTRGGSPPGTGSSSRATRSGSPTTGAAKGSAPRSSPRSSRPRSSRRPGARSTRPRSRTTSAAKAPGALWRAGGGDRSPGLDPDRGAAGGRDEAPRHGLVLATLRPRRLVPPPPPAPPIPAS